LENKGPLLVEKQIEVEKLLEQLREETEFVGKRRELLLQEEEELNSEREEAHKI